MPPISSPGDAETDLEVLRSVPKQFAISDEKAANWLVRKVIASREYAARAKAWADLEIKRAEREEHCLLFLYGRQLESWTKDEIARRGGKRKSIAMPAGVASFRSVNPSLQIDDEQAVLVWAKGNLPDAIIITEKLSRSILADHFKATGEIPSTGAHVDKGGERFSIR